MFRHLALGSAMLVAASMPASAGPTFILTDAGGAGAGTAARAGFEQAASIWASLLSDDVVVRLSVGMRSLRSGVLGSASSTRQDVEYSRVRTALLNDRTSALDFMSAATLSTRLGFMSNEVGNCATGAGCSTIATSVSAWDDDQTRDNQVLRVNTSLQRALGLTTDTITRDATISFSSSFRWDFDRSDGIGSGTFDFVGIALHEIGHALGFGSGIDYVDSQVGRTGLDMVGYGTVLDLFRYQDGVRDWTVGGAPCLSADGGDSCLGLMATGTRHGDGRQAGHWKDNRRLGIMDPTAAAGELLRLTELDISALDIIGWDVSDGSSGGTVMWDEPFNWGDFTESDGSHMRRGRASGLGSAAVPAPATLSIFGLGALVLGAARRRG